MKRGKKIAIVFAVWMFAMAIAGAASAEKVPIKESVEYSVNVKGIDVSISIAEADFGDMAPGVLKELSPSFTLDNTGGLEALVEAAFTAEVGGTYGLTNSSKGYKPTPSEGKVIPADKFDLNKVALDIEGKAVEIGTVTGQNIKEFSAGLNVPSYQEAGKYKGTVELIFSIA